jgi:hypothetical protein
MASTGLINLEPMKWGGKDLTMVASKARSYASGLTRLVD